MEGIPDLTSPGLAFLPKKTSDSSIQHVKKSEVKFTMEFPNTVFSMSVVNLVYYPP